MRLEKNGEDYSGVCGMVSRKKLTFAETKSIKGIKQLRPQKNFLQKHQVFLK